MRVHGTGNIADMVIGPHPSPPPEYQGRGEEGFGRTQLCN
jgi:hypothetical protein